MEVIRVLMCGSDLSVKGGMSTVIKNYLSYTKWKSIMITYIPLHVEGRKISKIFFFLNGLIKILFLCVVKKIDVVHLHTAERGSFYRKAIISKLCGAFGIQTIMHHHSAEFEEFYSALKLRNKRYVSHVLENVDLNLVLGNQLIGMITKKAPRAKVKVLNNSVDTYSERLYNVKATGILFLGRFGRRKGIYDLLQVIKILDEKIDRKYMFYLCGDGEIDKVKKIINSMKISHRIGYIGWLDLESKKELYKKIKINILPSYNEGFPMTILETMAYGIPNISTRVASIPEIIKDGSNGVLIEPGSVGTMAETLYMLLNNDELCEQMSKRAYNDICEKYSVGNNYSKLEKLYIGLVKK